MNHITTNYNLPEKRKKPQKFWHLKWLLRYPHASRTDTCKIMIFIFNFIDKNLFKFLVVLFYLYMVGQKLLQTGLEHFGETRAFFQEKEPSYTKNLMLNIFMLNSFFGKSVFSEETAKSCSWGAHFGKSMCNNFWSTLYKVHKCLIVKRYQKDRLGFKITSI